METMAFTVSGPTDPKYFPSIPGKREGLSGLQPHPRPSLGVFKVLLLWGHRGELPGSSKLALPYRNSGPIPRMK